MVKWIALGAAVACLGAAVVCCQAVAGISDRELDPAWNQPVATAGRRPPERQDGGAGAEGGVTRYFGARALRMGSVDPETGLGSTQAWRKIGYDIDGKCTTAAQSKSNTTGVCLKPEGGQDDSLADGEECRDNAAGRLLAQSSDIFTPEVETDVNNKLRDGKMTGFVLRLDDLGESADDAYVPGALYVSSPPVTLEWQGKDVIPVDPNCLLNGALETPKYYFPTGYLRNHTWVSNDFGTKPGPVPLVLMGRVVEVDPLMATLTVQFNETNDQVLKSVMAVVMSVDQVREKFLPALLEMTSCSEQLAKLALDMYVTPNADLAAGVAPFVDPSKTCDAMSLAFEFEWPLVMGVSLGVSPVPTPSKCGDGGVVVPEASADAPDSADAADALDASEAGDAQDASDAADALDSGVKGN